jgi:hypothetical protein
MGGDTIQIAEESKEVGMVRVGFNPTLTIPTEVIFLLNFQFQLCPELEERSDKPGGMFLWI